MYGIARQSSSPNGPPLISSRHIQEEEEEEENIADNGVSSYSHNKSGDDDANVAITNGDTARGHRRGSSGDSDTVAASLGETTVCASNLAHDKQKRAFEPSLPTLFSSTSSTVSNDSSSAAVSHSSSNLYQISTHDNSSHHSSTNRLPTGSPHSASKGVSSTYQLYETTTTMMKQSSESTQDDSYQPPALTDGSSTQLDTVLESEGERRRQEQQQTLPSAEQQSSTSQSTMDDQCEICCWNCLCALADEEEQNRGEMTKSQTDILNRRIVMASIGIVGVVFVVVVTVVAVVLS